MSFELRARAPRAVALTSPAFVLAIVLLVLNDHLLKQAVGGWWTGKLSDIAGLFAFAVFWSAWLPSHRLAVHVATAIAFIAWKSPLADVPLAVWNALGVWPLARVVDYTDLVALPALLVAYRSSNPAPRNADEWRDIPRRLGAIAMAGVAILSFAATSRVQLIPVPDSPSWTIDAGRGSVRMALDSLGFRPYVRTGQRERIADTIDIHVRHPPERWISVTMEAREETPGKSTVRVVYIHPRSDGPPVVNREVFDAFATQVVEPVRTWLTARSRAPESAPPAASPDHDQ